MNTPTPRTTAPERIWLQDGDYDEDYAEPDEGITWCQDKISDNDTEYVRADLFAAAQARIKALEGDAGQWHDKWEHSCDALCCGLTLWIKRCPHCGRPAPDATIDASIASHEAKHG